MTSDTMMQPALRAIATRVCETHGRLQDFYLGAHLALNLLANHEEIAGAGEYIALLDERIEKEMGSWQASTN